MKFSTLLSCVVLTLAASQTLADEQSDKAKYPNLPDYEYNLTEEPLSERENICDSNIQHCINQCGGPDQAPKKFCNPETMGWGCGCLTKKPDYQAWQWPVNQAHCIHSGVACQNACTKLPVDKQSPCQIDCSKYWQCNGENQPPAYYNVDTVDDKPTYKPPEEDNTADNSTDNTDNSTTTSSENGEGNSNAAVPFGFGNTLMYTSLSLAIVAAGMAST